MGIAWNRADERRFEMKKCAPRRTRGLAIIRILLYIRAVGFSLVYCQMYATYISFVFLMYVPGICLFDVRNLFQFLFFLICLLDTWFEVFCHTGVIGACAVTTDSILAMR